MTIKEGSVWWAGDEKRFRVISVSVVEGNTWVHYREEPRKWVPATDLKEYSCYKESFVQRFSPIPE